MQYLYFLYLCKLNTKLNNTMKRFFLLLCCVVAFSLTACIEDKCNIASDATSVTAREEIDANPQIVIPTMTVYNGELFPNAAPAAPKGFEPMFIIGYLRHGSRMESDVDYPIETYEYFKKADEANLLTPLGKKVYEYMIWNRDIHENRTGELTDVGFQQHKQIAKRYYEEFPMLFKGESKMLSKGSVSLRASMSMAAFNEGMKECNSQLNNHMEASEVVTAIIRPQKAAHNKAYSKEEEKEYKQFLNKEVYPKLMDWGWRQDFSHCQKALFTDSEKFFAMFDEHPFKVISNIYKRLAFAQNLGVDNLALLDEVFTADERHIIYKVENARWYYRCASAAHPILANNMAQSRILVDYIVSQIDNTIAGKSDAKSFFCFGHDLNIIPLFNIFGMENMPLCFGEGKENIDYIAEHWRGYKITPKATNTMFILYRNKAGKLLVRAQINERDVEMPIKTDTPYYYDWSEVKKLAYSRLDEIDQLKKR